MGLDRAKKEFYDANDGAAATFGIRSERERIDRIVATCDTANGASVEVTLNGNTVGTVALADGEVTLAGRAELDQAFRNASFGDQLVIAAPTGGVPVGVFVQVRTKIIWDNF